MAAQVANSDGPVESIDVKFTVTFNPKKTVAVVDNVQQTKKRARLTDTQHKDANLGPNGKPIQSESSSSSSSDSSSDSDDDTPVTYPAECSFSLFQDIPALVTFISLKLERYDRIAVTFPGSGWAQDGKMVNPMEEVMQQLQAKLNNSWYSSFGTRFLKWKDANGKNKTVNMYHSHAVVRGEQSEFCLLYLSEHMTNQLIPGKTMHFFRLK
jgi:hypothetical protein